jgi:hypothetical protein
MVFPGGGPGGGKGAAALIIQAYEPVPATMFEAITAPSLSVLAKLEESYVVTGGLAGVF